MKKLVFGILLSYLLSSCEPTAGENVYISSIKEMEQTFQIAAGGTEWLWVNEHRQFGDSSFNLVPDTQYVSLFRNFERDKQETFDAFGDYYDKDFPDSILNVVSLHIEESENRFFGTFENPLLYFEFEQMVINSDLAHFQLSRKDGDTTLTQYFERYRWIGE